jgi:hypothetical protein
MRVKILNFGSFSIYENTEYVSAIQLAGKLCLYTSIQSMTLNIPLKVEGKVVPELN